MNDAVVVRDLWWETADGLRLHAREYRPPEHEPQACPILCLHGLTRNARDFELLAPHLARRSRHVIAAEMRGRGQSASDPARRYGLAIYADDVLKLLDAANIGRALFIGTSMGGLITMELAARHPHRVAGAVINDVGPALGGAGLARIANYAGRPAVFATWDEAAAQVAAQNATVFPAYGPAEWAAMARRLCRATDRGIVLDYDPAIVQPASDIASPVEPWAAWSALVAAAPVLLLRGGTSDLLEPATAETMAEDGATLVEIPGVGHAPMLDEPAALAAIEAFVDRVRGDPAVSGGSGAAQ